MYWVMIYSSPFMSLLQHYVIIELLILFFSLMNLFWCRNRMRSFSICIMFVFCTTPLILPFKLSKPTFYLLNIRESWTQNHFYPPFQLLPLDQLYNDFMKWINSYILSIVFFHIRESWINSYFSHCRSSMTLLLSFQILKTINLSIFLFIHGSSYTIFNQIETFHFSRILKFNIWLKVFTLIFGISIYIGT